MTLAYAEETAAGYTLAVESTRVGVFAMSYGWSSTPPLIPSSDPRQDGRDRLAELRARTLKRIAASDSNDWDRPTPADVIELRPLQFQTETWLRED